MAELAPLERLHYVVAGEGPRTLVLLHGFPQTWWAWHLVLPRLASQGFRVVAPDYRGAGNSWRPLSGYDKKTIAHDIRRLLWDHLQVREKITLVGHDIGLMVAYAYAQSYRDHVARLVLMDAPLPGTDVFAHMRSDPRVWHFAFHNARDVPEALVAGRERIYLKAFFNARIFNGGAIGEADLDHYTTAFSSPGGMRAGFELYRAFDQDVADNLAFMKHSGKLEIPVLAMGGSLGTFGPLVEEMAREVAHDVTGTRIPGTSHWIAEENPAEFVAQLVAFAGAT
jgi:pimeloyl-ACP methyl ester carboxylesterase